MATINGTSENDNLSGVSESDKIFGLDGDDTIYGNSGNDSLYGGTGNDVIHGESGNDLMYGGVGNDSMIGDSAYESGADTLFGDDGNDSLYGMQGDDRLYGLAGDDYIQGGSGNDIMSGGFGNDFIDARGSRGRAEGNQGTDTLFADFRGSDSPGPIVFLATSSTITSGAVVLLQHSGFEAFQILATSFADVLTGGAGNDELYGSGGKDTIDGGDGDDDVSLTINALATSFASGGDGNDVLSASFDLPQGISFLASSEEVPSNGSVVLQQTGFERFSIGGTRHDDTITTGAGDDCLSGGDAGIDLLNAGEGNDEVEFRSRGTITGGPGVDLLKLRYYASPGSLYFVASEIQAQLAGLPLFTKSGFERFDIEGTNGNDTIVGGNLADTIIGGNGADDLAGGNGADRLDGGSGIDWMFGGSGNDLYSVNAPDETVVEEAAGGMDTVGSSSNYTLPNHVEQLILYGFANTSGTGNSLPNRIQGSDGNNVLNGAAGADTMLGGAGNDTYAVDNALDVVTEEMRAGTDQINSSVTRILGANLENLTLTGTDVINGTGNSLPNLITGNSANNVLYGLLENDSLSGGGGNDSLYGGNGGTFGQNEIDTLSGNGGADRFVLGILSGRVYDDAASGNPGLTDYALITDFTPSQDDRLQLKGTASQYFLGNSPISGVSGRSLWFDSNGNGTLNPASDELIAIIRSAAVLNAGNTISNAFFAP